MRTACDKIVPREAFLRRAEEERNQGRSIVFSNGCFDLLHAGHTRYLEAARLLGDCLFLGLNTDRSVQALKGPGRPLVPERQRAEVLAALEAVDWITLFDEPTPLALILGVRPRVLVKGGDYTAGEIVGAREVTGWGGRVEVVPLIAGLSTTRLLERMREGAPRGSGA